MTQDTPHPTALEAGLPAPTFTLASGPGQTLALTGLRGQAVILAFYPADWSPVCSDQLAQLNERWPEIRRQGATIVAISVDSLWCHAAFAAARGLRFPLLADFEPKGAIARRYGVYRGREGLTERALFLIDAEGIIRWSEVAPLDQNPGVDGVLDALSALSALTQASATTAEAR